MDTDLTGKTALVVGMESHRGEQAAKILAEYGATVIMAGLNPQRLDALLAELHTLNPACRAYPTDPANRMALGYAIDRVIEEFGRLDIAIYAAEADPEAPITALDEWDWQRTLNVTVGGAFNLFQLAGRVMQEQRSGVLLILGKFARPDCLEFAGHAAYWAAVEALNGLAWAAQEEFRTYNIYADCVYIDHKGEMSTFSPFAWNEVAEKILRAFYTGLF